MQSIVMHLDMNSYFASVEQQDNPEWRGKPVGVCEHLGGIIIAASVEAKKWGISTGTPVWEARKLYPKIILTHTHAERYRFYTRRFLKVVGDYTDKVEKYSIDECFLDLTKQCNIRISGKCEVGSGKLLQANPWEEAASIAAEIKVRFKTEVGDWLRCSVGIADDKVLAKVGSDLKKPDGLVVILSGKCEVESVKKGAGEVLVLTKDDLYDRLSLTDIPGIGHRQEKNLNELGIKTLKHLRDFPHSHLIARFGRVMGYHLYNLGQLKGTWKEGVQDDEEIKSMGHMYTLPQQYRKPEFFVPVLYKLCEMVGRRLRRKELVGNVIHFFFHDKDWQGFGKSIKLGYFVQDGREIFLEVMRIIDSAANPRLISGTKIIGITVAGLRPYVHQLSLFGDEASSRRLVAALDNINDRYGEFTIMRAQMAKAGKVFRDSVGFGRMKEL
jgi:DNA polymerase IV